MEGTSAIPDRLYFRIGDVAELVGVKPYVLRYWETEFPMIAPEKSASGQRVYRRADVETILMIKRLLYDERYSIEGARKRIRELKKDGELKSFRRETLAALAPVVAANAAAGGAGAPSASAIASVAGAVAAGTAAVTAPKSEALTKARQLVSELRALAIVSASEIFRESGSRPD